ncbi:MAG: hypothetical protein J6Y37_09185 [Paludibacteraceae bacterium]|nr:hypothetical protein [Paludibacteraceae bacterium]
MKIKWLFLLFSLLLLPWEVVAQAKTPTYSPELHYTDVDGISQVYTNEVKDWKPISPASSAKVVVRDEYGKEVSVWKITFSYRTAGLVGRTFDYTALGGTLSPEMVQCLAHGVLPRIVSIYPTIIEGEEKKNVPPLSMDIKADGQR